MNKILSALVLLVLASCATAPVHAQEDTCTTVQEVKDYYAQLDITVEFEDADTLVLSSSVVTGSLLESNFDDKGCLVTQAELDENAFRLKYGEGV